jgi:hypothetical protein
MLGNKVMNDMELPGLQLKGNESEVKAAKIMISHKKFYDLYKSDMASSINEHRNYCQAEMKKNCLAYLKTLQEEMDKGGEVQVATLYMYDDLLIVVQRDWSDLPFSKEKAMEIMCFYTDKLVPTIASAKMFGESIRHFEPLSSIEIPNSGGQLRVPPSTEAFTLLIYKNCQRKWEAMHKFLVENRGQAPEKMPRWQKKTPEVNKEFKSLYSDQSSGQNKYGGWSKEGLTVFIELKRLITGVRQDKSLCDKVDTLTMQRLFEFHREKYGAMDGEKKKERNKITEVDEEDCLIEDELDKDLDEI